MHDREYGFYMNEGEGATASHFLIEVSSKHIGTWHRISCDTSGDFSVLDCDTTEPEEVTCEMCKKTWEFIEAQIERDHE